MWGDAPFPCVYVATPTPLGYWAKHKGEHERRHTVAVTTLTGMKELARAKQRNAELRAEVSALRKKLRDRERVRVKPTPEMAVKAIENLPEFMQTTAAEIVTDKTMKEVVMDVLDRRTEFRAEHIALLAGIGMNEKARNHFDLMLDKAWKTQPEVGSVDEVIVGGGLHAAIYAACRVKRGFPKPLVIERSSHPGGTFACSRRPGFYLNSRNRPGNAPSLPGDGKALNYLPGCDLQPADMGGSEYQTNDLIAWVVRCNLALYAHVWAGKEVLSLSGLSVRDTRTFIQARKRVIVATGPGTPTSLGAGDRIVNFEQFMAMMDKPFPLKGMNRIAVIGAGDAGKTVIEALTGQGPPMLTANSLDYPAIHWYGVPAGQRNRADWENCNRSRYKGIGRLLVITNQTERLRRVILRGSGDQFRASTVEPGIDCAYVDGRPYDLVVQCLGFQNETQLRTDAYSGFSVGSTTGSSTAGYNNNAFTLGVCARIQPSPVDRQRFQQVGENSTSIFYLARKTETLAMVLD